MSHLLRGVRISFESQGLISLLAHPLVRYCQFGMSPVNHSDSDSDVLHARKEPVILFFTRVAKFYVMSADVHSFCLVARLGFDNYLMISLHFIDLLYTYSLFLN